MDAEMETEMSAEVAMEVGTGVDEMNVVSGWVNVDNTTVLDETVALLDGVTEEAGAFGELDAGGAWVGVVWAAEVTAVALEATGVEVGPEPAPEPARDAMTPSWKMSV